MYNSPFGSAFDETMRGTIRRGLSIDPLLGTVRLSAPNDIFPRFELSLSAGEHSMVGGVIGFVAAVPEPNSAFLLVAGLAAMARVCKRRRQ